MVEFFFVAMLLLADGQQLAGSWNTEQECREVVEKAKAMPEVVAVSDCLKLRFERVKR